MRVFSILSWIVCAPLAIFNLVATFGTWIDMWGAGGAVFAGFLFPIAMLLWPLTSAWLNWDGWMMVLGYASIAGAMGFGVLGYWFKEKHEQLQHLN